MQIFFRNSNNTNNKLYLHYKLLRCSHVYFLNQMVCLKIIENNEKRLFKIALKQYILR